MDQTSAQEGFATQTHRPPPAAPEQVGKAAHTSSAWPKRERADALAREMVQLTAHISAAEARFLEMLAEFDREELWLCFGCHGAAQWLTWQCGLGEVAAREHVRVARALEHLPKIGAAFRRGEISYSKVREMTRIAIPQMEESLLNVARHGTAAHMQRLVRKYRRVERLEAAAQAAEQYRRRYVHYRHEDDGMLVIEARLPAEIGDVVMKAIDAAVEVLYQDGANGKREGTAADGPADDAADRTADGAPGGTTADAVDGASLSSVDASAGSAALAAAALESETEVPAGTNERNGCDHSNALDGSGHAEAFADEAACSTAASNALETKSNVPAGTGTGPERREPPSDSVRDAGRDCVREEPPLFRSWAEEVQEWVSIQLAELRPEKSTDELSTDGKSTDELSTDGKSTDELSTDELPDHHEQHDRAASDEAQPPCDRPRPELPAEEPSAVENHQSAPGTLERHFADVCCSRSGEAEASSNGSAYRPPLWHPHEMPGGNAVIEEFEGKSWPESLGARRADALRLLAATFLASDTDHIDTSADRYQVVVHIDQSLLASGTTKSGPNGGGQSSDASERLFHTCELEAGPALAIETARRLACDAALVGLVEDENGEPLDVGRKTRAIPPALARALRARDGGCRFPGCCRTRFTHGHHVIHWADGGKTKLSNLITLCTFHHGMVHEGGFSVARTDDGGFAFFGPDGERLPLTGRLDRKTIDALTYAAAQARVTLHELNRERDLEIDDETARCRWTGERMDYPMAVGCLISSRDRTRESVREQATH